MANYKGNHLRQITVILMAFFFAGGARAEDLMKDFDSLGGNDVLLERAKSLNPEVTTKIVQNRIVDLNKRFEVSSDISNVLGGDAYTKTWMVGINPQFHISPRWSVGFKYGYAFNEMSSEGDNLIKHPVPVRGADGKIIGYNPNVPALDYIKQQAIVTASWAPIYGKMNMLDKGVAHFDVYAIGGAGYVELESGMTSTYTAGGGVGLWVSQHLSSHIELRWQGYKAQRFADQKDDMNLTVASIQFGYLL